MAERVFNFGAGPAMMPEPVLAQIQEEFLNYQGIGASIIEISHRSEVFVNILNDSIDRLKSLLNLPSNFEVIYITGGAKSLFAAVPMNLIALSPTKTAQYVVSGSFANIAAREGSQYGSVDTSVSSKSDGYKSIPELTASNLSKDSSYVHITSNNTLYGTQWSEYPMTGSTPLIIDATSDFLSRPLDFSKIGMIYAGLQKNLGPSGATVCIVRKDLIGKALPTTPSTLNFARLIENNSMVNTPNTFAIYVVGLVLKWIKENGGLESMAEAAHAKSDLVYKALDHSELYIPFADGKNRSQMNITFTLTDRKLEKIFLDEALQRGLYALKGHRDVGGIRASVYNAMPMDGVNELIRFMKEFEAKHRP
mgnify:CR=1 FL=1